MLAPYSCVLQPEARDSLGIQLKDAIVIFDEAHNLLDAINSAHSAAVTGVRVGGVGCKEMGRGKGIFGVKHRLGGDDYVPQLAGVS